MSSATGLMTEEEHDQATGHVPSECDDCDRRAHEYEGGLGCWCRVCICRYVVGGNHSSDGEIRGCR